MSWLDQLRPARFRGVRFQVDTVDVSAGDNVILREYPFQDLPTVWRMGEGAEEIKFSAYVIGDDYIEQRDSLRRVLTGEGVLVHPTAGALRVYVNGKYSIHEAPTAEGGMARFDLSFVRAEARRYPVGQTSTEAAAAEEAAATARAVQEEFVAGWSITNAPGWVADAAVGRLATSLDAVWAQLAAASAGLGEFTSQVIGRYQQLRQDLDGLVRTPRLLAAQVAALFELPGELSKSASATFQAAFSWMFNLGSKVQQRDFETVLTPAPGSGLVMYGTGSLAGLNEASPARQQLAQLTSTSDRLFETLATAAYVQAAAAYELTSYDEAMEMRRAINAQCQRLLLAASAAPAAPSLPASSWHDAVVALHAAALADLQARSTDLVRLTTYTPQSWQPVWSVSYRLFGTADYADEILALNPHIRHPLLVPPGIALRVQRHD